MMALLLSSSSFGVCRPIILVAVFVIWMSLLRFFTVSILKKHVEQYSRIG